jgi:hypothetical protein
MNMTDLALMFLVGVPVVALASFLVSFTIAERKYAKVKETARMTDLRDRMTSLRRKSDKIG